jgi:hypothetical protein
MNKLTLGAVPLIAFAMIGSTVALGAPTSKRVVIKIGQSRTFSRAELRPGATVSCSFGGHTLTVLAPSGTATGGGALFPGTSAVRFHLNISKKTGDQYIVRCGRGGNHWSALARAFAL